ncbi:hypothetical protein GALMADRAFT_69101 [Galerina marginata CBS 339.88]|uniref:Calcineurin-like phosphoesterase domain-containing protein n=1 Tax=Galerina marginata (strain CBS 339.88) TaxID=685588 RepID=A0A067T745_GALM3|nr:hypothetical protein GALMADRAFT_69101 [Galerina marginata CBS 339.88]
MAIFSRRRVVNVLRILWVLIILWYELGSFSSSASDCNWPDSILYPVSVPIRPSHVLLVADPQIVDRYSYPSRGAFLSYLTRVLVDLNLRKNWRVALQKRPDVVVFLGDMMDNGRSVMPEEEYEAYYRRFSDIFRIDKDIPRYFIPGNHDIGLGKSLKFSPDARHRYSAHFGYPNQEISVANHSLILFDAPSYADEDSQRHGQRKSFEKWVPIRYGALDFMKKFSSTTFAHPFSEEKHTDPVILFSHIPLYRSDGRGCGPLREKGTLRPGVGHGYQNTLEKRSSQRLLEFFKPVAIFSGDDHDYCEYTHQLALPRGSPQLIHEITVKTISMVMNVRRPGFQLLSLAPADLRQDGKPTYSDTPCLLPDQLGIYLNVYIPLLAISLLIVFASNIKQGPRPSHYKNLSNGTQISLVSGAHADIEETELGLYSIPPPVSIGTSSKTSRAQGWFVLQTERRGLKAEHPSLLEWFDRIKDALSSFWPGSSRLVARRRSWLWIYALDIRDVAIFPLCTFVMITWWVVAH